MYVCARIHAVSDICIQGCPEKFINGKVYKLTLYLVLVAFFLFTSEIQALKHQFKNCVFICINIGAFECLLFYLLVFFLTSEIQALKHQFKNCVFTCINIGAFECLLFYLLGRSSVLPTITGLLALNM